MRHLTHSTMRDTGVHQLTQGHTSSQRTLTRATPTELPAAAMAAHGMHLYPLKKGGVLKKAVLLVIRKDIRKGMTSKHYYLGPGI